MERTQTLVSEEPRISSEQGIALSDPQFPHLQNGDEMPYFKVLMRPIHEMVSSQKAASMGPGTY